MPNEAFTPEFTDVSRNLEKRDEDIRAMFDRVAPRYDRLNHLLSWNMDVAWRKALVKAAEVPEGGTVLDCATGTGDVLFAIMEETAYTVRGTGLDFAERMLERAERKAHQLGYQDRTEFVEANMLDLPFEDNQFDAVSVAFGLRNVSDVERALAEMVRVAKPGGRVLILEFMRQPPSLGRVLLDLYCRTILPLVARVITHDGRAYRYLAASRERFLSTWELGLALEQAGLLDIAHRDFFLGIATLHVGLKPFREGSASAKAREKALSEELMG